MSYEGAARVLANFLSPCRAGTSDALQRCIAEGRVSGTFPGNRTPRISDIIVFGRLEEMD